MGRGLSSDSQKTDIEKNDTKTYSNVMIAGTFYKLLTEAITKQEVCHHPTLILGKGAFLDIGLFEKCLKFRVGIGFNMAFIDLDCLHLKVWKPASFIKK